MPTSCPVDDSCHFCRASAGLHVASSTVPASCVVGDAAWLEYIAHTPIYIYIYIYEGYYNTHRQERTTRCTRYKAMRLNNNNPPVISPHTFMARQFRVSAVGCTLYVMGYRATMARRDRTCSQCSTVPKRTNGGESNILFAIFSPVR